MPVGVVRHRALRIRLLHAIKRTERQSLQRHLGIAARQGRGDDHGKPGLLREQMRQRGDAVHVRHRDIQNHDIGIGALEMIDRLPPGAKRGYDLDARLGFDPAAQKAAGDRRIVNHHDSDRR